MPFRDSTEGFSGTGQATSQARLGFLILASGDPERFNRGQHVDFLRLLGDVVTAASAGCAAGGLAGARRRAENR